MPRPPSRRTLIALALLVSTSYLLLFNSSDVVRALAPTVEAAMGRATDLKEALSGLPINVLAVLMVLHILRRSVPELLRIVRRTVAEARRCPTFRARLINGLAGAGAAVLALAPLAYYGHEAIKLEALI